MNKIRFINISVLVLLHTSLFGQHIYQVDCYALPWNFRIEGQITDSLVRNYKGYSRITSIKDSLSLIDFAASLSLPTLYPDTISKRRFDPRVVIDIWISYPQKKGNEDTPYKRVVMLNERKQILCEGIRYHRSDLFIAWLHSNQFIE
ncbi:MAG: hypothetical protein HUU01_16150 [Saprospiraceae bacterium]|nr:hypothetical protein [Saprospiraceae bacterium]